MRRYIKFATVVGVAFVLLVAMARVSGFLLLPLALALLLGLGYVAVQILTGSPSPYPRIASGVFERSESTAVQLSERSPCESCTDWKGPGERRTTHKELVFLGVPLVRLSTTQIILCEVCADPLATIEDQELDAIDRELERGR
ncbi:hypothetical protein D3D02_13785 [Halobellus sp. Atlit-38R]|jgi:hypothetical protein|uniref:hypothetical protein n=1 Tax=Halobellus sp. Atlit-38R TaxID=2282131 RepID=UPI000EF18347|nr:hypothetical protein [Halobellus sp. Atlit-38R]RLM88001.1 hypothetical protein D3D02_13785 [Halobellus sp. Atlit-38R]